MSERAIAHYAVLAEQHGFSDAPSILMGERLPLLQPPDRQIPIRNPSDDLRGELTSKYAAVIEGLGPFLVACTLASKAQGTRMATENYYNSQYDRHLTEVVPKHLHPSYLSTGKLKNIQIQAAAPSEISFKVKNKTMGNNMTTQTKETLASWVYLVTSADTIPLGPAELGYTAFLTVVHKSPNHVTVCHARQFTSHELQQNPGLWKPINLPSSSQ
jgi:hypothetical protein